MLLSIINLFFSTFTPSFHKTKIQIMKKILFVAVLFFGAITVFAQSKEKVEFRLTLRDGNIVTGSTKVASVSLITDYGKLDIPIKNVSSIEMGITPNKVNIDKITNSLKLLSDANEQVRSNAYSDLVKQDIGAIPIISDYIGNEKYEPSANNDYTPEGAMNELMTTYNIKDGFATKDVVSIDNEYTMGGSYSFTTINLVTEFGTLDIPRNKIERIEVIFTGADNDGDKAFKLQASKHISSNQNGGWLKTGITLKSGQTFSITATGEVSLQSLSGAKYKPDGSTGATPAVDGVDDYGAAAATTYPSYGNVVYKIGDAGVLTKAGAKFKGKANSSGMLYISIYETVYNAANTGTYNVKIKLN